MPAPYIWILPARQRVAGQRSAYPELFAVLGGQTPDLRGLFLRGYGGKSAALGVQQGDAIRNITGKFGFDDQFAWNGYDGAFTDAGYAPYGASNEKREFGAAVIFDASRVVPTAGENRPVNQAVRYLVRARP